MDTGSQPRAPARTMTSAQRDQGLHTVAMWAIGRQHLGQSVVVEFLAGQRPAHLLGDVEVAETHRIRVAQDPLAYLGAGPHADAR